MQKCTKLSEKSYLTQKEPCDKGADARKRVSHLGAARRLAALGEEAGKVCLVQREDAGWHIPGASHWGGGDKGARDPNFRTCALQAQESSVGYRIHPGDLD